ncbi:MAG: type sorting protein, partial [Bacteroidota bacterium]|nr:type sorting protein [Bacteroidota bacterium]
DAIKASGSNTKWTAHIWIDNNIIVGHDGTQQTCGISTKIPSWDWTISRNQILEAGTGLYLGNSDGSGQFVYGIIEYNFVSNPVGYCMQIKHQNPRDGIYGIPAGNFNTVVRHNVFTKNDRESPDGDRPNLLIGGQPFSGIGVDDRVEVYGNFFYGNPREYLMQATGNLSIHNNIFINCAQGAVNLRQHNSRDVKELYVYCNTVYGTNNGIMLWNQAPSFPKISVCNAVFCAKQFNMLDTAGNIYGVENDAGAYFNEPDLALDRMDFYPKNKSDNIIADLQQFAKDSAWSLDFNGNSQIGSYYGAYSGFGSNPGWKLALEVKKIENHTLVRDEDITVETPAVNVYPNPVESVLCFDLSEFPPGEINIKIFDINGKCLIKNKFESFTDNIIIVDIVSLLPGIYEYSITNEKNSCCGKFVKH